MSAHCQSVPCVKCTFLNGQPTIKTVCVLHNPIILDLDSYNSIFIRYNKLIVASGSYNFFPMNLCHYCINAVIFYYNIITGYLCCQGLPRLKIYTMFSLLVSFQEVMIFLYYSDRYNCLSLTLYFPKYQCYLVDKHGIFKTNSLKLWKFKSPIVFNFMGYLDVNLGSRYQQTLGPCLILPCSNSTLKQTDLFHFQSTYFCTYL